MYFPRVFIFNTSIIAIINSILINNIMIILGAIMIVIKMKKKKIPEIQGIWLGREVS